MGSSSETGTIPPEAQTPGTWSPRNWVPQSVKQLDFDDNYFSNEYAEVQLKQLIGRMVNVIKHPNVSYSLLNYAYIK